MYKVLLLLSLLNFASIEAQTIFDSKDGNIQMLFQQGKAKYVIRYNHQFTDTLFVPNGSEVSFEGGRLSGPIVFNKTSCCSWPSSHWPSPRSSNPISAYGAVMWYWKVKRGRSS